MKKSSKIKAVVFDLDGTLVDSVPDILAAINYVFDEMGRRSLNREEIIPMIGTGAINLVEMALMATGDKPARPQVKYVYERFIAYYQQNSSVLTKPFPGTVETLKRLKASGYAMGVCTNKPHDPTLGLLARMDLEEFFSSVKGGDALPVKKPDPGHLRAILDELDATAEEAIMIGDSHIDINTAKAAGVTAIAVSFGYAHGPVEELGADHILHDMAELPDAIETFHASQKSETA